MPPRVRKPSLFSPNQNSPFVLSRTCQYPTTPTTKSFSSTPFNGSRQRQDMWRWLQGPGAAFRNPLPGSTNYLNAYDANGNLIRASRGSRKRNEDFEDSSSKLSEEDSPEREETKNIASGEPIPKEGQDDLMPFPLNRHFRSQPVLSEELREEIWNRVVLGQQSVKIVSAALNVEISRVGAVVRLKSVEKEWEKQVSKHIHFYSCSCCHTIRFMMSQR